MTSSPLFDVYLDNDIYKGFLEFKTLNAFGSSGSCVSTSVSTSTSLPVVDDINAELSLNSEMEEYIKTVNREVKVLACKSFPQERTPLYPPVQLPIFLYTTYKKQNFRGIFEMIDDEKGNLTIAGKGRNKMFIRLIEVPPSHAHLLGKVFSAPSRASLAIQGNTESGWDAWKDEINHKQISVYREQKQGQGFINPVGANLDHRDYLLSLCEDPSPKYYTSEKARRETQRKLTPEQLFAFLERALPEPVVPKVSEVVSIKGMKSKKK